MNIIQPDGTVITLEKEQEEIVHAAVHAINSGSMLYQYSAPAGCGKSVVLRAIVQELNYKEHEIAPMAYTGAAAMVMKHNGFITAKTCHSWMYQPYIEKKYDYTLDKYLEIPQFKWKRLPPEIKLIIIDEASMIDMEVRKDIEKNHLPVIACGDLYQLPPVEGKSAYLDPEKEPVDRLTKIMRQATNSAIVMLSNFIRNGGVPKPGHYGEVDVINANQVTDTMLTKSEIIICGYNNTRDKLTEYIRESLGYRTVLPTTGEKIVCRENNWDITVHDVNMVNGMIGWCENVDGSVSQLQQKKGKTVFRLNFRPMMFPDIAFCSIDADYNYFISGHAQRQRIKYLEKTNKYLKRIKSNKFEFGYVVTTHMSQGNQYSNGVYISQRFDDIQSKLDYTGLTRFRNHCIYVISNGFRSVHIPPLGIEKPMKKVVMYIDKQPQF